MKSYENIADLIENLTLEVNAINNEITTLQTEPQSFNEQIIFQYIATGSTGKTKDFVRSLGVKSERGSLFSSGDVSKLIKAGSDDISPELLAIARKVANMKNKNGKLR
ncbi:hypothetical protein [Colwellia sp. C1TZA3]|uniref:hypothetical protein n=1 Tax=Colwellia sp. C1TZA3 TaxID=2508879 RepID=UPI0011B9FF95|nr:hypothetical protein [Colwellia sp. C1TZA3]TWX68275.1 hypothetical protein ESZ39_12490 [Colwellia sp. C1TZA3]